MADTPESVNAMADDHWSAALSGGMDKNGHYDTTDMLRRYAALLAEADVERLRAALAWYGQQASDCGKITPEGTAARTALDRDGGQFARAALRHPEGES